MVGSGASEKSARSPVKIDSFLAGIDAGSAHVENSYTSQNGLIVTKSHHESTVDEEAVKWCRKTLHFFVGVEPRKSHQIAPRAGRWLHR